MEHVNWTVTEAKAARMTDAQLVYARRDAREAAEALEGAVVPGKDAGYYRDEASVYARELARRVAR